MMPSMEDAPKPQNGGVGIGGIQESEAKIGKRNSTGLGCAVRTGSAVRVGSAARVVSGARAGKGRRAMGAIRPRHAGRYEMQKPGVWLSQRRREEPSQSPSNTMKQGGWNTELSVPRSEMSNFLKLKEEVVKHAQSYIRRHALAIGCTLAPDHEAVKCLSAFGDQAQKFAAKILSTIEWGTQHWKLQESFPVPLVPKWLRTLEYVQTMTPMRGKLPLVPLGTHYEDICVHCPAVWAWMAVLLQFWQDHMTHHLYGGCFCQASELANTLIQDINMWMPHSM